MDELAGKLAAPDMDVAGLALGELVELGRPAVPTLVAALRSPTAQVRGLAAEGLGMIGDQASADALAAVVDDTDDVVRAKAATALLRLRDGRWLDAAIRTINDYPDVLHSDLSLSAYALASQGPAVGPRVVELLRSSDVATRRKAAWVLRSIAAEQAPGRPAWQELLRLLDGYDPDRPLVEEAAAVEAVAAFLTRHAGDPEVSR
jgi:HEAT repeat protein